MFKIILVILLSQPRTYINLTQYTYALDIVWRLQDTFRQMSVVEPGHQRQKPSTISLAASITTLFFTLL